MKWLKGWAIMTLLIFAVFSFIVLAATSAFSFIEWDTRAFQMLANSDVWYGARLLLACSALMATFIPKPQEFNEYL